MDDATANRTLETPNGNVDPSSLAILDHLAALKVLGWRHAMTLKDGRNQVAMLEREVARSRSAMEQFLAVTLARLKLSDTERAVLADRLRMQTDRSRRLATRLASLATDLRSKTAEVEDARLAHYGGLADGHFQIRTLTVRIRELEAQLADTATRERADSARVAQAEIILGQQAETADALAASLRREEELRSERARSRWIAIGRVLGLTKL